MGNRSGATVRRWATALLVAGMSLVDSASATLLDRGPDMVYDDVLNITWTRQAGDGVGRNWANSVAWADALVFGGFSDWRLPWASVSAGAGPILTLPQGQPCTGAGGADEVACRDNEMAYMFYYDLGGNLFDDKTGSQTALGGEVLTGIRIFYWSGTEFDSDFAYGVFFGGGTQNLGNKLTGDESGELSAWAVRPGDVAAVPEPETYAMMLIGLLMLGATAARRKQNSGLT